MNSKQRRQFNRKWKYVATLDSQVTMWHEESKHTMNIVYIADAWVKKYMGYSAYMMRNNLSWSEELTEDNKDRMYYVDFLFKDPEKFEWFLLRWGDELVQQNRS